MPGVVMANDGIPGCGLTPLFGMLSIDSVVNTDWNCWFKMFTFCLVSATSCPSFFKGATPLLSVLSDFMKEKSFFGFDWLLKLWSGLFVGRSRIDFLYRCCKHVSVLSGPDVSTVCISLYICCPFSFWSIICSFY